MASVEFPYSNYSPVTIPERNFVGRYSLPAIAANKKEQEVIQRALSSPVGTPHLRDMLEGKKRILIVSDDHHRPTPIKRILPHMLQECSAAGVRDEQIDIIMALGSHRAMTEEEIEDKLGADIVKRYRVFNHEWTNEANLSFEGKIDPGIRVWINKKVKKADIVLGLGRIMPLDICGFTGGGKILIPGLCGEITNSDLHWIRVDIPLQKVVGKRDNPIRDAIDKAALAVGLSAIVNVILDGEGRIYDAVFGHPVEAHRKGSQIAARLHTTNIPEKADIVIADGYPFDVEFWQVNKALDNAGLVVKDGGVIIIVSPCYEGISKTHEEEILRYGYRSHAEIRQLVAEGVFQHRVVAVHMMQVAEATVEKNVTCILVTDGIPLEKIEKVGFRYAPDAQTALQEAFRILGSQARVLALNKASEMLPVIG